MTFFKEIDFQATPDGQIPKDWQNKEIEGIATDLIGGGTPNTAYKEFWNGNIAWMTSAHINGMVVDKGQKYITIQGLDNSATHLVPKGNLLIATRVGIGKVAVNKIDIAISQDLTGVIIDKTKADPSFLYWAILSNRQKLKALAQGSTIKGILRDDLGKLRLKMPTNLNEQKAIVEVLCDVNSAIEYADRIIAKTEQLKRGLMQQLLTHGIGHTETKQTPIGEIPKEWEVVKFDDANERIFVGIATSSTKHFVTKGIPLIRNQNIKETGVDLSDLIYITKEFADANKSKALKENDIVTVRTGVPGLSSKVTKEMEGWQTFTTLISRPKLEDFDPDFLVYALNSHVCKNQVSRLQFGLAQQNLNVGSIVNLYVPKPPKAEQVRIAERIKTIYAKQRLEKESFEKLIRIKQALMDLLLTGKVRIKVD